MKVISDILRYVHLDRSYSLLSSRNVQFLLEIFNAFDIHGTKSLNDLQFLVIMKHLTDLSQNNIYLMFDVFDIDGSGSLEFDEFYLIMCILTAIKDKQEKQFIFRHSRTVFDLMDEDGSNTISAEEFGLYGFIFNFHGMAVKRIFNEFDVSGDQELDYKEFKMFAMACIDKQEELEAEINTQYEEKCLKESMRNKARILREAKRLGLQGEIDEYNELCEIPAAEEVAKAKVEKDKPMSLMCVLM